MVAPIGVPSIAPPFISALDVLSELGEKRPVVPSVVNAPVDAVVAPIVVSSIAPPFTSIDPNVTSSSAS